MNRTGFHLYEMAKIVKLTEAENRRVAARGWRNGGLLVNVYEISVMQDE